MNTRKKTQKEAGKRNECILENSFRISNTNISRQQQSIIIFVDKTIRRFYEKDFVDDEKKDRYCRILWDMVERDTYDMETMDRLGRKLDRIEMKHMKENYYGRGTCIGFLVRLGHRHQQPRTEDQQKSQGQWQNPTETVAVGRRQRQQQQLLLLLQKPAARREAQLPYQETHVSMRGQMKYDPLIGLQIKIEPKRETKIKKKLERKGGQEIQLSQHRWCAAAQNTRGTDGILNRERAEEGHSNVSLDGGERQKLNTEFQEKEDSDDDELLMGLALL